MSLANFGLDLGIIKSHWKYLLQFIADFEGLVIIIHDVQYIKEKTFLLEVQTRIWKSFQSTYS